MTKKKDEISRKISPNRLLVPYQVEHTACSGLLVGYSYIGCDPRIQNDEDSLACKLDCLPLAAAAAAATPRPTQIYHAMDYAIEPLQLSGLQQ